MKKLKLKKQVISSLNDNEKIKIVGGMSLTCVTVACTERYTECETNCETNLCTDDCSQLDCGLTLGSCVDCEETHPAICGYEL